jgi:hypothetical protein
MDKAPFTEAFTNDHVPVAVAIEGRSEAEAILHNLHPVDLGPMLLNFYGRNSQTFIMSVLDFLVRAVTLDNYHKMLECLSLKSLSSLV